MLGIVVETSMEIKLCIWPINVLYYMNDAQETGGTKPREIDHLKLGFMVVKIAALSRHELYNYLGKSITVAGEHTNQVLGMLCRYKEILEIIASCPLPIALKIEALGMMGMSKIEHHFSNTYITEEKL